MTKCNCVKEQHFINDTHEIKNVDINIQEDRKFKLKNKMKEFVKSSYK